METPLFGNNLCNLLSNKVIEEFSKIDLSHKTTIQVINLEQFIVIKGRTSINNPLNYSKIFKSFLVDVFGIDLTFNTIDLVEYGSKIKLDYINLSLNLSDYNDLKIYNTDLNIQGEYELDFDNQLIIHNNYELFEYIISNYEYKNFNDLIIKADYPFVSEPMFGKSLYSDKVYNIYLKYISYNLFEKQLCKDISFNLTYYGDFEEMNYDNMLLTVDSCSSIVSIDWMKSLILDLFDFNFTHIKKHLSLDNYDFSKEILSKDKCWMLRDKTSEMILL